MKIQNSDGLITIIEQALVKMPEVGKWQQDFIKVLFVTLLLIQGKVNFSSLANHSDLCRKTYRRGFKRSFDFESFNLKCIEQRPIQHELVAAIDASFIPKRGKQTEGLGYFFNGCVGKAMRGLEVSEIALIDSGTKQAYAFSSKQTIDQEDCSRMELYTKHLKDCAKKLPSEVRHLLADGHYTKHDFVEAVRNLKLDLIGKLRCDANLKHLYQGEYQGRGRPKLYDGKVDFTDLSRFKYEGQLEKHYRVYSQQLYHVSLKRIIQVVLLLDLTDKDKPTYILLFSTDLTLNGFKIIKLYRLRFQIEFLFRDAKQFTGLSNCQARDATALNFHFNAAFSAVNLAKLDLQIQQHQNKQTQVFVFSLASYIRKNYSHTLLIRLLTNLDFDLTCPKINIAFNSALNFGFSDY